MMTIGATLSYLLQSAMILALCFLWVAALLDIRSQMRTGVWSPSILVVMAIAISVLAVCLIVVTDVLFIDNRGPELEAPEQSRSLRVFDAILPVEDVRGPAVDSANGTPVRERFDLSGAFLAALAVAGDACDGSADRFEFDASARAPGSLASSRWLSHPLLLGLSS
jgi:hypothetical protein